MDMALRNQLAQAIQSKRATFVIGSGVSVAATNGAQVASWGGLIENGLEFCCLRAGKSEQWRKARQKTLRLAIKEADVDGMIDVATSIEYAIGKHSLDHGLYRDWLHQCFDKLVVVDRRLPSAIHRLATGPLITFNYDNVLASDGFQAVPWTNVADCIRLLRRDINGTLHIHGHYSIPSSVVLGSRSYQNVIDSQLTQMIQQWLFSVNTLVFVGFGGGFRDPNLTGIVEWIRGAIPQRMHPHFILVRDKDIRDHPFRSDPSLNICPIPYGADFEQLPIFLDALANEVTTASGAEPASSEVVLGPNIEENACREITEFLSAPSTNTNTSFQLSDFSFSDADYLELARTLVGMANSGGGTVRICSAPSTTGPRARLDELKLHRVLRDMFNPPALFGFRRLTPTEADADREKCQFLAAAASAFPNVIVARRSGSVHDGSSPERAHFHRGDVVTRDHSILNQTSETEAHQQLWQRIRVTTDRSRSNSRYPLHEAMPFADTNAPHFVGRAHELLQLWNWFFSGEQGDITLVGSGGHGKTALAYEFARCLAEYAPSGYGAVVWVTAKAKRFVDGNVKDTTARDFFDLPSLLSALQDKLFASHTDGTIEECKLQVKTTFSEIPSLIVADDVDSLEAENDEAIAFLRSISSVNGTRVLFTTRRVEIGTGWCSLNITGLPNADARNFTQSLADHFGIPLFTDRQLLDLVRATEGIPLFLIDIVRLVKLLGVAEAVARWKERAGADVRMYALGRELEMQSRPARAVLLACAIADSDASMDVIQQVSGLSASTIADALPALNRLFLMSSAVDNHGVAVFSMNANTKRLVLEYFAKNQPDKLSGAKNAYRQVVGGALSPSKKQSIGSAFSRAVVFLNVGKVQQAESVILPALKNSESADLWGLLASVYLAWKPHPRTSEARNCFIRAHKLRCRKEETYERWYWLERDENSLELARNVVDDGLRMCPDSDRLMIHAADVRIDLAAAARRATISKEKIAEYIAQVETILRKLESAHSNAGEYRRTWSPETDRIRERLRVVKAQQ